MTLKVHSVFLERFKLRHSLSNRVRRAAGHHTRAACAPRKPGAAREKIGAASAQKNGHGLFEVL
jgi:hypothetical protein